MNRKYPEIPFDAVISRGPYKINFKDKYERGVGLSTNNEHEFHGICEYGGDQIISCYRNEERDLSIYDLIESCRQCPHYKVIKINHSCILNNYLLDFFDIDTICSVIECCLKMKHFPNFERENKSNVYFISDGEFVKIGVAQDYEKRLNVLQIGNARELKVLGILPCENNNIAYKVESCLHMYFYKYRKTGEWFDILHKLKDVDLYMSGWE